MRVFWFPAFLGLLTVAATSCSSPTISKRFELSTAWRTDAFGWYEKGGFHNHYAPFASTTCRNHFMRSNKGTMITKEYIDNLLANGVETVSVERDNTVTVPLLKKDMSHKFFGDGLEVDGDGDGYVDTDRVRLTCYYTEYIFSGKENMFDYNNFEWEGISK